MGKLFTRKNACDVNRQTTVEVDADGGWPLSRAMRDTGLSESAMVRVRRGGQPMGEVPLTNLVWHAPLAVALRKLRQVCGPRFTMPRLADGVDADLNRDSREDCRDWPLATRLVADREARHAAAVDAAIADDGRITADEVPAVDATYAALVEAQAIQDRLVSVMGCGPKASGGHVWQA